MPHPVFTTSSPSPVTSPAELMTSSEEQSPGGSSLSNMGCRPIISPASDKSEEVQPTSGKAAVSPAMPSAARRTLYSPDSPDMIAGTPPSARPAMVRLADHRGSILRTAVPRFATAYARAQAVTALLGSRPGIFAVPAVRGPGSPAVRGPAPPPVRGPAPPPVPGPAVPAQFDDTQGGYAGCSYWNV